VSGASDGPATSTASLVRCVGDVDRFAAETWGRRPDVYRGRGSFADLLTTDDVERLLRRHARRPAFRVVRDGPTVAATEYTRSVHIGGTSVDDVADVDRIVALAAAGATVVVQGLQHTWDPLARFCEDLTAITSHRVQANAYLSPAGTTALRRHADTHHVLVLQVEGAKQWDIDGVGEVTLEAGDVAYVPAGVQHAAWSGAEHSLHITLGLLVRTHRDALLAAAGRLLDRTAEASRPLALGYASANPPPGATIRDDVAELLRTVGSRLQHVDPDDVVRHEIERVGRRSAPLPAGVLRGVLDPSTIADTTLLRPAPRLRVDAGADDAVVIRGERTRLTAPAFVRPALEALVGGTALRVCDLPGLDADDRLVLARRLVRDGFATPVPPDPNDV
jgi:mannose-6-phosphate isomerase-like protein (cupin superfamily)